MKPFEMEIIVLQDLIEAFAQIPREQVLPIGLHKPHSYRGDYMDLAFEAAYDVPAGDVTDMLAACVNKTFEGYKGGDFTMNKDSWVWISEYGTSAGDRIGPVLLHFLTNQTTTEV